MLLNSSYNMSTGGLGLVQLSSYPGSYVVRPGIGSSFSEATFFASAPPPTSDDIKLNYISTGVDSKVKTKGDITAKAPNVVQLEVKVPTPTPEIVKKPTPVKKRELEVLSKPTLLTLPPPPKKEKKGDKYKKTWNITPNIG